MTEEPKGKIEQKIEELVEQGWLQQDAEDYAYLKQLNSWTALSEQEAARVKAIEEKYKVQAVQS